MSRPRVFLDFSVANEPLGRVIFELFSDEVPRTCENFRSLCTGEKGLSTTGVPLYYKNSVSHRIIQDFMIQAGDFTKRNGTGGESIYGASPFADEDLSRPLDAPGLLCMANKGPNTNSSQFFVTLRECPHLNGKHVVFGKVIRGYDEVVAKLGAVPVDEKSRPLSTVLISNCGELELRKVAKRASPVSDAGQEDEGRRQRKKKRSESADSDRSRADRKKKKKKSKRSKNEEPVTADPAVPIGETEEEYDARLEREELERIEAQRKKDLERLKERYDKEAQNTNGGVRLKGRGRMMYVDPEFSSRR
ncbi:cyclophilin-like domain-containing protein [Mycena albidolilacea]|uniref:peptidylprolyl isomerase n=1 Tax=Mycena albidolilacea TaxID=1033008 RepID=A0AAD7EW87_9AGAR|nr:cyclophilin-like domain-containing protein [Mycena albidolilacea]